MDPKYSLEELAASVCAWCDARGIRPANGQAAEAVTERTIRYYRTLGLLDAPAGGPGRGFGEKHRLQLLAVRLYQAQGLPLRKIREELYGLGEDDLGALVRPDEAPRPLPMPAFTDTPGTAETWAVETLGRGFLLVSRRGHPVPPALAARLRGAVDAYFQESNRSETINPTSNP